MVNLPPMRLGPESAAWGRAIEKLLKEMGKTTRQQGTQIGANNTQAAAGAVAVAATNEVVVATQEDIAVGRQEPSTPTDVVATSTGSWDATGTAQGDVVVSWGQPGTRTNLASVPRPAVGAPSWSLHAALTSTPLTGPVETAGDCLAGVRNATGGTALYGLQNYNVTAVAGDVFMVSIYTYFSAAGTGYMRIAPGNTTGVEARLDFYSTAEEQGTWVRRNFTWTASASGTYSFASLATDGEIGAVYGVAGLLIEQTDHLLPYFDGSTPPSGDFTYAWAGAINSSISAASVSDTAPRGAQYEVWWKPNELPDDAYIRLGATTIAPFEAVGFAPGLIMAVRVRAVTALGIAGPFSLPTTVTLASPANTLLPPSAPTLTSETGVVVVTWDGKLADGVIAPPQVGFARAFISASSTGTYLASGQTIQAGGNIVISEQVIGSTCWVKLGLIDNLGRVTPLSTAASVVVTGLSDGLLTADSLEVWPFKVATIPSGSFEPGAISGGDIANFAITALKYNDTRHHIF